MGKNAPVILNTFFNENRLCKEMKIYLSDLNITGLARYALPYLTLVKVWTCKFQLYNMHEGDCCYLFYSWRGRKTPYNQVAHPGQGSSRERKTYVTIFFRAACVADWKSSFSRIYQA